MFFFKGIFTVSNFNACKPLVEFHRELSLLEKSCKEQLGIGNSENKGERSVIIIE